MLFLSSNNGAAAVSQVSQHVRAVAPHLLPGGDRFRVSYLMFDSLFLVLCFSIHSLRFVCTPVPSSPDTVAGSRRARDEWTSHDIFSQYPAWFELHGPVVSLRVQDTQPFPSLGVSTGPLDHTAPK